LFLVFSGLFSFIKINYLIRELVILCIKLVLDEVIRLRD